MLFFSQTKSAISVRKWGFLNCFYGPEIWPSTVMNLLTDKGKGKIEQRFYKTPCLFSVFCENANDSYLGLNFIRSNDHQQTLSAEKIKKKKQMKQLIVFKNDMH